LPIWGLRCLWRTQLVTPKMLSGFNIAHGAMLHEFVSGE
jgi:hypothetical protein